MGSVEIDSLPAQTMRTLCRSVQGGWGQHRSIGGFPGLVFLRLSGTVVGSRARRRAAASPECPEAQGRQQQNQEQSPGYEPTYLHD